VKNKNGNGKEFKLSLIATNGEKRNTDAKVMEEYPSIMSEVFHSLRHVFYIHKVSEDGSIYVIRCKAKRILSTWNR
jgi:hypothetical protein